MAGDGNLCHNFCPFVDTRPGAPPSERYKAICGIQSSGLVVFSSPDGVHWSRWAEEPAIPADPDVIRFDSQNVALWSEHEGCYACYFRVWHGGYLKGFRSIARRTSPDLVRWRMRHCSRMPYLEMQPVTYLSSWIRSTTGSW